MCGRGLTSDDVVHVVTKLHTNKVLVDEWVKHGSQENPVWSFLDLYKAAECTRCKCLSKDAKATFQTSAVHSVNFVTVTGHLDWTFRQQTCNITGFDGLEPMYHGHNIHFFRWQEALRRDRKASWAAFVLFSWTASLWTWRRGRRSPRASVLGARATAAATGHSARTRAAAWREPVVSHVTVASQPSRDPFVMKVHSQTH